LDATAYIKIALDVHAEGLTGGHQVSEDFIGDKFVKNAHVAVGINIQFERFQLDEAGIRDIGDVQGRKVWLPRHRADTGKLGNSKRDTVQTFPHQVIHYRNGRERHRLKVRSRSHTLHA